MRIHRSGLAPQVLGEAGVWGGAGPFPAPGVQGLLPEELCLLTSTRQTLQHFVPQPGGKSS